MSSCSLLEKIFVTPGGGYLGGTSSGNNGEQGGRRAYCGNVILVEETGTIHILDKLDITRVEPP